LVRRKIGTPVSHSESRTAEADFDRDSNIILAAYKKADLPSCIPRHLTPEEHDDLLGLIAKFE